MYTAFYGLREKPFALLPDPRFLFLAQPHREALAHMLYGIEQGDGFIAVTGEVGMGKTMSCCWFWAPPYRRVQRLTRLRRTSC